MKLAFIVLPYTVIDIFKLVKKLCADFFVIFFLNWRVATFSSI